MRRPTISVVCPTNHRGPLVAESLSILREVVDEIIVAADARVEATDLAYYADFADVVLRYEHAGANRHWPWLVAQARGDWVLLLDGDELAGAALIEALPELVADRRVRQYSLPIQWPWPAPETRLAEEPWLSNRRHGLLRNDPGLTFGARKHALADPDPPIRYLDELPLYHLDLLLPDRARREAKVTRYDAELFGLLTLQGLPFNEAFYLPEAGAGPRETVAVPPEDAERIRRALDLARDDSRELDPSSLSLHDRETITWHARRTALPEEAYRGSVELARPLPPFSAGLRGHRLWVEVANEGTARWPGGDGREPLIRLGMAWQPLGGGPRHDGGRALLPHALEPGQRALLPVAVAGPPQSGPAELVLDLVHEHVRWFNSPLAVPVEVGPSVEQRLATLAERHGGLVPVDAAMRERRAVGARDGLLRQGQADPWALDEETIDRVTEVVRAGRPSAVVEFGSGKSTVVLASLLAELHEDGPRLVAFEQDPAWAKRSRKALADRGLDQIAIVIQLEIGESGGGPPGYLPTGEAVEYLRRLAPQLVLVDGPTLASGASRLGTLDLVAPYLRDDATVLLDDALRDAELCVATAWERRDDLTVHGIRPTSKGLLEATLKAG